jgi:hypothetical protein
MGGLQFTCIRCPHSVRTLDLDLRNGNLRTQAATALNHHATQVHNQPTIISATEVQQRIWRSSGALSPVRSLSPASGIC